MKRPTVSFPPYRGNLEEKEEDMPSDEERYAHESERVSPSPLKAGFTCSDETATTPTNQASLLQPPPVVERTMTSEQVLLENSPALELQQDVRRTQSWKQHQRLEISSSTRHVSENNNKTRRKSSSRPAALSWSPSAGSELLISNSPSLPSSPSSLSSGDEADVERGSSSVFRNRPSISSPGTPVNTATTQQVYQRNTSPSLALSRSSSSSSRSFLFSPSSSWLRRACSLLLLSACIFVYTTNNNNRASRTTNEVPPSSSTTTFLPAAVSNQHGREVDFPIYKEQSIELQRMQFQNNKRRRPIKPQLAYARTTTSSGGGQQSSTSTRFVLRDDELVQEESHQEQDDYSTSSFYSYRLLYLLVSCILLEVLYSRKVFIQRYFGCSTTGTRGRQHVRRE